MRFTLKEVGARVVNVNPRAENHGNEKKPTADLKLCVMLPNDELDQFDKSLRDVLYQKATKGQKDMHSATERKLEKIRMFKWEDEVVGGTVTLIRGIDAKSNLEIEGCIVTDFRIEPLDGGSVSVTFTAKFHPVSEKQIGKLCLLTGQDVVISVTSPTEREQQKQRDMLENAEEEETEA